MPTLETVALNSPPKPHRRWPLALEREVLRDGVLPCVDRLVDELGDIFQVRLGIRQFVVLAHPEYARHVLVDDHEKYTRGFAQEVIGLLMGEGLLTSDGDEWRAHRRIGQPYFSKASIESFIPTMVDESLALRRRWDEKRARGETKVDMAEEMLRVTMRVVSGCLFGQDVDEFCTQFGPDLARAQRWALRKMVNPLNLPMWVPTPMHLAFRSMSARLDRVIHEFINSRREGTTARGGLLSALQTATFTHNGRAMNEKQLRDACVGYFIAGHETTATSMTWLWYHFANFPDIYQRTRDEILAEIPDEAQVGASLHKLKYTRQVVYESLRMYSPTWVIPRRAREDDQIGEYRIRKGTDILVYAHRINRHPDYWDDPNRFDPDRFADEDAERNPAFLAFGVGPRMCIGKQFAEAEMLILCAILLRKHLAAIEEGHVVVPHAEMTLRPQGGLPMVLC
ncbi:MAG: cytochrome P450 [Planctomycetota bacterium]